MKQKNRDAIKGLKDSVYHHRKETTYSAVEVDVEELETLLRWAQDKSHHYFVGDRVKSRIDAAPPQEWLVKGDEGTVIVESDSEGICRVEWDEGPDGEGRVRMYHNEIRLAK